MPERNTSEYVMLPWTIRGPSRVADAKGVHYEMRVLELPDFLWQAPSESAALYGFKKALRAHLEAMIATGETPPQPSGRPVIYGLLTPRRSGFLNIQLTILQV
jgi:hypothetical protein